MSIGTYIQTADWKAEKHAPVIECPDVVKAGEEFVVSLEIGKEIPHPNTTEHHIDWIEVISNPNLENSPTWLGNSVSLAMVNPSKALMKAHSTPSRRLRLL